MKILWKKFFVFNRLNMYHISPRAAWQPPMYKFNMAENSEKQTAWKCHLDQYPPMILNPVIINRHSKAETIAAKLFLTWKNLYLQITKLGQGVQSWGTLNYITFLSCSILSSKFWFMIYFLKRMSQAQGRTQTFGQGVKDFRRARSAPNFFSCNPCKIRAPPVIFFLHPLWFFSCTP